MKTFFIKVVQIFMEIIFSLLIATKTRRQQLADQNKQQISCRILNNFLIGIALISNFFKEMLQTKNDLHEILDNFYLKRFHIKETRNYDNLHV